jgi:WS/DGAT/MGAT family acyltransferase
MWLPEVVNEALYTVRRATGRAVEGTVETILDPGRAAAVAGEGAKATGVLGRLALMPADPQTLFKGPLGTAKRCAWSRILPLDEVKAYSKSVGATINDVLLAGVAGALRRYLIGRGEEIPDGLDLRAIVPVNLRPEDAVEQLGNRFGLVFLALPVGTENRDDRLRELKRRMDAIKNSTEAVVTYAVLNALGTASSAVESQAVRFFGSKASAVMTNVPGPREELYLAGKAMRSMMFWVPQAAHLGLGVSVLSYAGQVRLGVVTDVSLVPDPTSIIEAFQDEMAATLDGVG